MMTVGILGLGLIGGSLARAYSKAGHHVLCCDKDEVMLSFAQLSGVVDDKLDNQTIPECDLILLAIFAGGSIAWLEENARYIRKGAFVIDCCGVKQEICEKGFSLAQKHGFIFVGGHPMAGSHNSGFKYSRSNLFQGAPMVIVPPKFDDPELLQYIEVLLAPCKFGSFSNEHSCR